MASLAIKHIPLFFLVLIIITILSSSTHARDSQFFNKIPASTTTPNNEHEPLKKADQEPSSFLLPQNEESYGHETGLLPPSTESKESSQKYRPKNYNPYAYVTVPENANEDASALTGEEQSLDRNPNFENGNDDRFHSQQKEDFSEYRYHIPTGSTTSNRVDNKNHYHFNSPRENMRFNNNNVEGLKPEGMSDTKFLENGKYHYDVNSERFGSNHPYEMLRGNVRESSYLGNNNRRNYYGNYNSVRGYQNQDDADLFQDEESNMP